ncbi:STAS domain-containing protein [Actinomadura nitritigenes]|uniref:STAS domain-containing protein n=1 Tax=Actinomadura nitritigenes TaxID=134602 RepID=UPI003D8D9BC1
MTTPNGPVPPDDEPTTTDLSDADLDAALAAGDAQLLDYARAHADPAAALNALFKDSPVDAPADLARPSFGDVGTSPSPAAKAANHILARALANDLAGDLEVARNLARNLARDLVHLLDVARDIGSARTPVQQGEVAEMSAPPDDELPPRASMLDGGVRRVGPWLVVQVSGELDLATAPGLIAQVGRLVALSFPPACIALDMAQVSFCDSSGINALVRLGKRISAAGGQLLVLAPRPRLAELLTRTGVDQYVRVVDTLPDAPGPGLREANPG